MTASVAQLRTRAAYVEKALADPTVTPSRRRFLQAKQAELRLRLADRCVCCNRQLSDPRSVGNSIGPTCARQAVAS